MSITLQTRSGRWAIQRLSPDRLARVRDRALRDLLDDLDAAIDVLDGFSDLLVEQKMTREAEIIHDVLLSAHAYLAEIRQSQ
jgi:hypothetical protein